jgi:hypothetical protein
MHILGWVDIGTVVRVYLRFIVSLPKVKKRDEDTASGSSYVYP